MIAKCPHCGNQNARLMQDNGAQGYDLTLLCVAPVAPGAADSFDFVVGEDKEATGFCGMQWSPAEVAEEQRHDSCPDCPMCHADAARCPWCDRDEEATR